MDWHSHARFSKFGSLLLHLRRIIARTLSPTPRRQPAFLIRVRSREYSVYALGVQVESRGIHRRHFHFRTRALAKPTNEHLWRSGAVILGSAQ